MSNVQECIDLYLTDEEVTDAQFRAVIVDARARDLIESNGDETSALLRLAKVVTAISDQVEEQGRSLVLLNRIDSVRQEQFDNLGKGFDRLLGFCDSQTGALRVLRERLDNMEGK